MSEEEAQKIKELVKEYLTKELKVVLGCYPYGGLSVSLELEGKEISNASDTVN